MGLAEQCGEKEELDLWTLHSVLHQAAERGAKRIRVHTLTDGRDTEDGTSVRFMQQLVEDLAALRQKGCDARVASGGGRMIVTMDRYEVGAAWQCAACSAQWPLSSILQDSP